MDKKEYKYDVAFSFLAVDESLATELNDLLQDRVRTFMYSKKQGEIAGTDGEKSFNEVFGEQSRLVVVLYREGWGMTPWTRIEETAIRNRAFDHGYDFVKFVPLDDSPTVPKWLPRTQLWVGIKRWGIPGTASVIEARIEELGGEPHEESVQDRAARLERSLIFKEKREKFLNSSEGVNSANEEYYKLQAELERLITSIISTTASMHLTIKKAQGFLVVLGLIYGLSVNWFYRYSNTLDKSYLDVSLWNGHPPFPGIHHWEEPNALHSKRFNFELLQSGGVCWISSGSDKRVYTTIDLASYVLRYYMDKASEK